MWWKGSIASLFMIAWSIAAWKVMTGAAMLSLAMPLLLSIMSALTDEAAEGGGSIRGKQLWDKCCANSQWALAAFYLLIMRGISFPGAPKELAVGLFVLSCILGLAARV